MTPTESPDRFQELKAHAKDLGWELIHRDVPNYRPWGYVLRKIGSTTVDLHTNSAARLDPEDLDDPLTGLDSVSHMLDQIEEIQKRRTVNRPTATRI